MRVIKPVTITDAILTSSTAPETAPSEYNAGTTYADGETCYTGTVGGVLTVWESLQNSNTGNTPASSPAWWQDIGSTYAEYDAGTTYSDGDIVHVVGADSHKKYESLQDSNVGNAPATATDYWLDLGPTNRWAAFDYLRNTRTVAKSPLVISLSAGQRCNSIAVLGLVASTITIEVSLYGVTKYTITRSVNTRDTATWYDYFFGDFNSESAIVCFVLPPYTDADINVTITRVDGDPEVGAIVIGNYTNLGSTGHIAECDAINYSTIERDVYGNATLTQRRNVPRSTQKVFLPRNSVDKALRVRDDLNATPAVWSALDDQDTDYFFNAFAILGIYRRFVIEVDTVYDDLVMLTLELEEI